jgi:hypothetical protein
MRQHPLLLALLLIATIAMLGFVGITLSANGDAQPALLIFVGLMAPIATTITMMVKQDKTLFVSEQTDKKVDQLLNGSLQTRLDTMDTTIGLRGEAIHRIEQRVGNMETALIEINAKLSR